MKRVAEVGESPLAKCEGLADELREGLASWCEQGRRLATWALITFHADKLRIGEELFRS